MQAIVIHNHYTMYNVYSVILLIIYSGVQYNGGLLFKVGLYNQWGYINRPYLIRVGIQIAWG